MTGALSQLVAYGAQDVYLTGDPKTTFWKAKFARYTNFAMESIRQDIVGTVASEGDISFTLTRSGDLVSGVILAITMKRGAAVPRPYYSCEQFIDHLDVYIGGQKVFEFNHEWFRMYWELFFSYDEERAYNNMAQWSTEAPGYLATFYLPIPIWFNALDPGRALPLIALQYHEVQFKLKLANINNIVGIDPTFTPLLQAHADYVFLDTKERVWFAQNPHEYLIQQVQENRFNITIDAQQRDYNYQLTFNHPTKALIWACSAGPATHGQYTGVPNDQDFEVLAPLDSCKLMINGVERFSERKGSYFSICNPWTNFSGGYTTSGVYTYGFGIHSDSQNPSGTINFSRIDSTVLRVRTKAATIVDPTVASLVTVPETQTTRSATRLNTFYVWGVNYNVLRIMSGMGGLAYAS